MAGIARGTIDFASTHVGSSTHTSPAQTKYIGGSNCDVYVNGFPAIKRLDLVGCGEFALTASTKVFINGLGVHRLNDLLDSHAGTYSVSVCESASTDVFSG